MRDFARSDDLQVQAQLDRLGALSVPQGRLGLETIHALMDRLGNPHRRLPPVFHVAGTNGKGSTCAYLRAILEAEGCKVHATISPHLVRYNERIRIAGELISDDALAALLAEVLDAGEDLAPSFFEVTIAASFLAFSRTPADACVIEVGLGGRFDATNVIEEPAVCGIATLGIDHERFLLAPEDGTPTEPLARIAFEKAGIAKPDVPLVTLAYPPLAEYQIERSAMAAGAKLAMRGRSWTATLADSGIHYVDRTSELRLPMPGLPGWHQADNAALATAMVRHQDALRVSEEAIASGVAAARWPGRLHRLAEGPLTDGREVWLDGGHNLDAGQALRRHFGEKRFHLILGMLDAKDPKAITGPLAGNILSLTAVPVPGHDWHEASAFGPDAVAAPDVSSALLDLPEDGHPVLIGGSLYLAGEVLRLNEEIPD